jgi:hypothetical protein
MFVDAFHGVGLSTGTDERDRRAADEVLRLLTGADVDVVSGATPRAEFFANVTDAVLRFIGDRRLLLVVDDLQWADNASARLLDHLLTVVPSVIALATMRFDGTEPREAGDAVRRLRTTDRAMVLELEGLGRYDVEGALRDYGATQVDAPLVNAVHDATNGNPLYVREIGRHLAAGHPEIPFGTPLLDAIGVPRGLAELIDANIARLGAPVRQVLETCAVIGGAVELGVLERASTLPEPDLYAAIDRARQAGFLVDSASGDATLRFDHPLVREVLLHALGPARRARLHQRVADAIESYHGREVDRFVAELAHHLAAAANLGTAHDAIEFAIRAGERAEAVCAYDEAAQWYAHALRLAREREASNDDVVRLLTAQGRAQNHAGDANGARATLLEAVGAARATGRPEQLADVVRQLGGVLVDEGFEGGAVDGALVALLRESIDALPADAPLRARLLVRLSEEQHFAGDRAQCLSLCDEAERIAREAGDDDALGTVIGGRHFALYGAPALDQRVELLVRLEQLRTSVRPDSRWMRDYLELGDMAAVEAATAHFEHRLETAGIASDHYYPAVVRATLAALRGQLDAAETAANEALEVGRRSARGPDAVAGVWAAQIFAIRLFDGRLAELRDIVEATADGNPKRPIWRAAAAFLHLELDDRERAAHHLDVLRRAGLRQLPDSLDLPLTVALLAWVAAEVGSDADVEELRGQLQPYRDLLIVQGAGAPSVCAGPATFPLAVLEARLGNETEAESLLDEAEQRAVAIGAVPWRDRIRRYKAARAVPAATIAAGQA